MERNGPRTMGPRPAELLKEILSRPVHRPRPGVGDRIACGWRQAWADAVAACGLAPELDARQRPAPAGVLEVLVDNAVMLARAGSLFISGNCSNRCAANWPARRSTTCAFARGS